MKLSELQPNVHKLHKFLITWFRTNRIAYKTRASRTMFRGNTRREVVHFEFDPALSDRQHNQLIDDINQLAYAQVEQCPRTGDQDIFVTGIHHNIGFIGHEYMQIQYPFEHERGRE